MATYQMTSERAKKVLAFRGVPSREAGMIQLLRASGLESLSGNGLKRGFYLGDAPRSELVVGVKKPQPIEACPRKQLYAAAQRMYRLALDFAPELARSDEERRYFQSPAYKHKDQLDRCSAEWKGNLREWLNLDRDQAKEYSITDLEVMLCGE